MPQNSPNNAMVLSVTSYLEFGDAMTSYYRFQFSQGACVSCVDIMQHKDPLTW